MTATVQPRGPSERPAVSPVPSARPPSGSVLTMSPSHPECMTSFPLDGDKPTQGEPLNSCRQLPRPLCPRLRSCGRCSSAPGPTLATAAVPEPLSQPQGRLLSRG